ncbi:unnamed protein product [Brachionus calyciflorus]|uniref:E3 ubiquitin-protein ligase KCMF1 n=1 Tax=Brachionus calyciflorus TaxID=104777 RepID=A0A813TY56_9BILA|nr:unnamed protein product [Brachionus calyciflorus]
MSNFHEGVSCDMCSKSNFTGKRYKCLICYDFDQCETCHEQCNTSSLPLSKPINPNHNHLNTHPMQCILTKTDFELFYGAPNGLNDYGEQISFTCPYCGKLGFSESSLSDHLSTQHLNNHQNENLPQEVVCPICAALPSGAGGGDPNHLTEDLLHHIHLEHMNNRNLIDLNPENFGSGSVAAAAALRFSRRLNYAQNAASSSNRGSGIGTRGNTFRFQFGNPSSSSSASNALSSFMRSAGSGIDPFSSTTGSGGTDPIVELLSQLTGVRRAANSNSANLTLAQLTRERESLQQQSAAVARHHHHLFGTGSSKLGFSGKTTLGFGQNASVSQNQANNQSNTASQQNAQYINQLLELPNNLLLQPLPPNTRDSRYLLSKFDFSNVEKNDNQTQNQTQQQPQSSTNIQMNNKQSILINDIVLSLLKYQISNSDTELDNEVADVLVSQAHKEKYLPNRMKFLALFFLISVAVCENPFGFTDEQLKALAELESSKLPTSLIPKAGDAYHWCCTNEQPVQIVQRTKIVSDIHTVATKIKTGYTNCGFGGLSRCSIYSTRYKQVAVYRIETYDVPDEQACLDHHVKCCNGYIEVAGNCLSFTTISQNMDLISQLVSLGLISG